MTPPHLLPAPPGIPPRLRPAEALNALVGQLPEDIRAYACTDRMLGVLSLPGISVWTNGRVLWWQVNGEESVWPAADPNGAVRILESQRVPDCGEHPSVR